MLTGFAGECYVMAELLRQGVIAGLSPRNARAFFILAIKDDKNVKIRVKTRKTGSWRWSIARGTIFPDLSEVGDFTVLVDLAKRNLEEMFYIIKTVEIDNWLKLSPRDFLNRVERIIHNAL